MTRTRGGLRVVALRTGGRNGSPVLLVGSVLEAVRRGFADPGQEEAGRAAFIANAEKACTSGFKIEETTPLKAALRAAIDDVAAAEDAERRGGRELRAVLWIASDLREQQDAAWKVAIRRPTPANLEAVRKGGLTSLPKSIVAIEVCGLGQTDDRLASEAERENVKLVLRAFLGDATPVSFAGTCPRSTSVAAEGAAQ